MSSLAVLYTTAFQEPNPNPSLDGDPCCGHPDTWGDVAVGALYFAATATAALGFMGMGVVCLITALLGRVPDRLRGSTFLRGAALAAILCAVAVPLSWLVRP